MSGLEKERAEATCEQRSNENDSEVATAVREELLRLIREEMRKGSAETVRHFAVVGGRGRARLPGQGVG
jgi:hypothetical protein